MAPGDLDQGFGTSGNGIVITDFKTDFQFSTRIFRILVEPNRRIVAAGVASGLGGSAGALARYDSKGVLDPTFGFPVVPVIYPAPCSSTLGEPPTR
jgi:hypothetical protein